LEKVTAKCHVTSSLTNAIWSWWFEIYLITCWEVFKVALNSRWTLLKFWGHLKISVPVNCLGLSLTIGEQIMEFLRSSQKFCPSCKSQSNFSLGLLKRSFFWEFFSSSQKFCPVSIVKRNRNLMGDMIEQLWCLHILLRQELGQT